MKSRIHVRQLLCVAAGISFGCSVAPLAIAQSQDTTSQEIEEIVVTGTSIQGIDPVGSNVIGVDAVDIEEAGVNSATDVLRRVPQVGNFNTVPSPTVDASIPFSPISLRGVGALSGMATLVLLDGNRIVPTSPGHNWIDTQMIPASVIERIDIVPDGGSAIYGSDAVAGVVNFVTKKQFEGVELSGTYGAGNGDFDSIDASIAYGNSWDSGSALISYTYADRSSLLGADLDYLVEDQSGIGGTDNRSRNCDPGNVTIDGAVYPLPGMTPGPDNTCSLLDASSFYPEEQRHSVFGTLSQDFSNNIEFELTAYWSQRDTTVFDPDNVRSARDVTDVNPFFTSYTGETVQSVAYTYQSVLGPARGNPGEYEAFQIMPSLSFDITDDWSARLNLNYGASEATVGAYRINGEAEDAAMLSTDPNTALNPYDPGSTNASVIAAIADSFDSQTADQDLLQARFVVDGGLWDLNGEQVRVALGVETLREGYKMNQVTGSTASPVTLADVDIDRDVLSLFAEMYLPVTENIEVSLAARYDDYSDVGDTTNPKIGVTWSATDWLNLRGAWGTSFHAPAMADLAAPLGYELFLPFSPFRAADSPFFPDFFMPSFLLGGASPGISPEEAETLSLGADFDLGSNLSASLTYWTIEYTDRIDQNAGFFFGPEYYEEPANFPYFILQPQTPQEVIDYFGDFAVLGFPDLDTMFAIFGAPYVVSDQRKQNLGFLDLDGVDFALNYGNELGNGEFTARVAGTYIMNRDRQTVPGSPSFDTLELGDFNNPITPLNLTGSVGYSIGQFSGLASVFYRSSADVGDESIDSFTTVSLFGKYDLNDNLSIHANIDNLFDEAPPSRIEPNNGGTAYIDYGFMAKVGFNVRF